jgi:methylated-DNA-[protein]-cysteine S-methyltransferase
MIAKAYYSSPIGWIEIQASHEAVVSMVFCDDPKNDTCNGSEILAKCVRQLDEYFGGQRTNFDLPVSQKGTTFQQTVWNCLTNIPFGKTVSYADVAKMINNPKSVRAVGAANGKNKVWIVVSCHGVIGADGSMTGYAGGIERKKWLLAHEADLLGRRYGRNKYVPLIFD